MTMMNGIIDRAVGNVGCAAAELVVAARDLKPLAVGDKWLITPGLEGSFERLLQARRSVAGLRTMLSRL